MRSPDTIASSRLSMSDREGTSTPISSASSVSRIGGEHKRRKLDMSATTEVDELKPVFLKMSFKKGGDMEEPDTKIEDDATYSARPWQERSTMVPLILAFRIQFDELFEGVPDMGPQDIEEGLGTEMASSEVQELMCRLLTLAANRARPVEYPQYNRPLNDCVSLHYATRGDPTWEGTNPLAANKRFLDLSPDDRLRLMYCLLDWALTESKVVREKIEEAYKNRTAPRIQSHNPYELNIIGRDDKKHGYYLIKGVNTRFRLYIETDLAKPPSRWYSICSTLEELRQFTSQLSESAKTVRCRKIVDDLASIYIPEVERAQAVCAQAMQKKARAQHERTRRAAYASELPDTFSERGSRTRGRRVDYNSMLQGQGEDEYGHRISRETSTPELPQSSRSGRMLKRPRGWDDGSPEADTRIAIANSIASNTTADGVNGEDEQDSLIVILKYNISTYRDQSNAGHLDVQLQSTPDLSSLSLPILVQPRIGIEPPPRIEEASSAATADDSQRNTRIKEVDHVPSTQTSTQTQGPSTLQTTDSSADPSLAQEPSAVPITTVSSVNTTKSIPLRHCLILSTLPGDSSSTAYLDKLLSETIASANHKGLSKIDILLYSDPRKTNSLNSHGSFFQLQSFLSSLYIKVAKLGHDRGVDLEVHVIFNDWCGYSLAKEDVHWSILATTKNDSQLAQTFLKTIENTYPDREKPDWISIDNSLPSHEDVVLSQQDINREYDVVAVGGTFDHLHAGHKILLTMTAWLTRRKLICGVTDDALLVNKKHKEVMQNISDRKRCVHSFYQRIKRGIDYEVVAINDVAGPTGSDASIQALVASRETEAGSAQIKELRNKNNLPPLDILFIDVIGPEGEVRGEEMASLKLSSTAIRAKLASKL